MNKKTSKINAHKSSLDSFIKRKDSSNELEKRQAEKVEQTLLPKYYEWVKNIKIKIDEINSSPENMTEAFSQIAQLTNDYKKEVSNFVKVEDIKHRSQKKLEPSVGEELLSLIFEKEIAKRNAKDKKFFLGSARCIIGLFFDRKEGIQIDTKDVDFAIYEKVKINDKTVNYLIVGTEFKTYIDKTMLDTANATYDKLHRFNSKARYNLVSETINTPEVVLRNSPIGNNTYVLRKQNRHDYEKGPIKNPIYGDVLERLYKDINEALDNYLQEIEIIKK